MVPQSDWLRRLDERDALQADYDKALEERTEARAELFRAQERVRELEDLIVRRYEAKTIGDQGQLDIDLYAEAQRIFATKRREGK